MSSRVYNYGNVKHVQQKTSFRKRWNAAGALVSPKGHDTPFKGAITGPEGLFSIHRLQLCIQDDKHVGDQVWYRCERSAWSRGDQK